MLERLVSKNAADCTSQRLKRTSGARVMIFLCLTLIGNCSCCFVFERYELVVVGCWLLVVGCCWLLLGVSLNHPVTFGIIL